MFTVIRLLNCLARWTQCDPTRMRRMMLLSPLANDKWFEKRGGGDWLDYQIQTHTYSVPPSLIGQQMLVRQYEWHLEVYYQQQLIQNFPKVSCTSGLPFIINCIFT